MSWKDAIRTIAPTVVGVLGTPAAGMAVKVLADTLLGGSSGDAEADEAKIADLLAGGVTPEVRLRLIDAEAEVKKQAHALRMALVEQRTELYKTDASDRDSARKAAVEGGNARRTFYFAVLIFVGVLIVEGLVLVYGLPPGVDPATAGRILGTLDAALLVALYYVFGSSSGSSMKNELFKR